MFSIFVDGCWRPAKYSQVHPRFYIEALTDKYNSSCTTSRTKIKILRAFLGDTIKFLFTFKWHKQILKFLLEKRNVKRKLC